MQKHSKNGANKPTGTRKNLDSVGLFALFSESKGVAPFQPIRLQRGNALELESRINIAAIKDYFAILQNTSANCLPIQQRCANQ